MVCASRPPRQSCFTDLGELCCGVREQERVGLCGWGCRNEVVNLFDAPGREEVRQRILELSISVWAFAAVSFALEAGVLDELSTPSTAGQISQRTGIPADLVSSILEVLDHDDR